MQLSRLKIGNVMDSDLDAISAKIVSGYRPTLVKPNGDIFYLRGHEDLWDVELGDRDLYFLGPHAEIAPLAAIALRRGLLDPNGDNKILHIDSHIDNELKDGEKLRKLFESFVEGRGSFEDFGRLITGFQDRVTAFFYAMQRYFSDVALYVRYEKTDYPIGFEPVPMSLYLDHEKLCETPLVDGTLEQLLAANRFQLFSVDGDFCGVVREYRLLKKAKPNVAPHRISSVFNYLITQLIIGLAQELQNAMEDIVAIQQGQAAQTKATLYTVSYDPRWVIQPQEFVRRFLLDFYSDLVHILEEGNDHAHTNEGDEPVASVDDV